MIPASFNYFAPASLTEALSLLSAAGEDAKLLAGGQSLVPLMKLRLSRPATVIDLGAVPGMNAIRSEGNRIVIGALATYSHIEESQLLRAQCPLLPQTAATVGDVQVRNQGTLGGALAHADPAGDMPAAILALDAELKAVGPRGERWIKARDFFVGLLTTDLSRDEILTEIRVPRAGEETRTTYVKAAKRASGFAVVGIAVSLKVGSREECEDVAVSLAGISDGPHRAHAVEDRLRGQRLEPRLIQEAAGQATAGLEVTADINGSSEYRTHLAEVHTARALRAVSDRS
ncbi:MAG TPA: xanthine dehydrogenase family protein subunit M [Candidatus Binatia bacterium]